MQIQVKNRETLTGAVTVYTNPVDATNMPLATVGLTVYAVSGTAPTLTVQLQTSDDTEVWGDVGSSFNLGTATIARGAFTAQGDTYVRYLRFKITAAGTNPLFNYSLFLNLFPST